MTISTALLGATLTVVSGMTGLTGPESYSLNKTWYPNMETCLDAINNDANNVDLFTVKWNKDKTKATFEGRVWFTKAMVEMSCLDHSKTK